MKLLFILMIPFLTFANEFHNLKALDTKGKELSFSSFKGKAVLVVNIATKCGYTGQLDDLEKLYQENQKDLVIVGVPSNDFGSQTPENDQEVAKFCRLKYGVSFPITKKVAVKGKDAPKFMQNILSSAGGEEIKWNFEKFLFDKNGEFVARFPSNKKPMEISSDLKKLLKK